MATPIDFAGKTHHFGPPLGREEQVGTLDVFSNGQVVVSAWLPTPEEREKIARGEPIFVSHWSGARYLGDDESGQPVFAPVVFPTFVGCESECAAVVADTGRVWKK
jgi:hypothetical protein